jgi:hypothetical protein
LRASLAQKVTHVSRFAKVDAALFCARRYSCVC